MVQIRAEAKKKEILRRAAGVFARKGFHGASLREIAGEMGLVPGALYYYFASKEDLLYSCQTMSLKLLLGSAREIAAADLDPESKLRRLVHAHLAHILDDLGGSFAHIEFHALPPERLADVVSKRDRYESIVRGVLSDGVKAGCFRQTDIKLAALTLLGALNWTVVWWRPDGDHDLASVADAIADGFLKGLVR